MTVWTTINIIFLSNFWTIKGKRKSTGSIPTPKKARLDHVQRQPHKFTPKDFKIFGAKNLEKPKANQKNKGGLKLVPRL